ncbi:zinc ribbon domain-containing protein YjdM [[Mycobacterium] wendilense]|uniref:Zinc ribbon domain-containing protein YjdM n=1 Tax=[Mycobacterium] wendilense TaxID=3064284 RepID=A0ABM9MAL1_9MYCO|nr:zinc ribbon domain-containing protein YjdM [Mycolicibacterium sp. MU0050]CAJ1580488.1 zinc ribbon domain-containing protein YjdM [Mycolicibacterium sp. MU0050]
MSDELPPCPQCGEGFTYAQRALLVCPMCAHEWSADGPSSDGGSTREADLEITDAVGNRLADGDTITVVKTVKVKGGGGGVIKVGTKVRGIRLISDGVGDHDIDATVPGFGRMQLKSSVVKKAL